MKWIYHFPDEEGANPLWEDILLLPEDVAYRGKALWITIDCLGPDPNSAGAEYTDRKEWYKKAQAKLQGRAYWVRSDEDTDFVGDSDMIVNAITLKREEVLKWVLIWLKGKKLKAASLKEAPIEAFRGRHQLADMYVRFQKGSRAKKKRGS